MAVIFRFAARSDVGLTRANNQDSAYAGPNLLVVADGMGGHAGGDIASSVAIAHLAPLDDEAPGADEAGDLLQEAIETAHGELLGRVAEEPNLAGLGTTVTALLRTESRLLLGHIGDSRAYLLRDEVLQQITVDHTFVQYLVETGKLDPDQAERHPQRSLLLRVLGDVDLGAGLDVSVREARPGDRWLLCSDGLSSVVSGPTLADTLARIADPGVCAERLIELALRGGGPDNVTCIVADVLDLENLPDGAAPSDVVQVVGAAAIDRDRPSRGGGSAAAKAASLRPQAVEQAEADDAEAEEGRTKRVWRIAWPIAVIILVLAAIGTGGYLAYAWTQTQYYVGQAEGRVAIYQGIAQQVGPLSLSHVLPEYTTDIAVDALPPVSQDRLAQTIPARNLLEAQEKLQQFLDDAISLDPGTITTTPVTASVSPSAPSATEPPGSGQSTPPAGSPPASSANPSDLAPNNPDQSPSQTAAAG